MASFNKFNAFVNNLADGVFNLASDTLKFMLSNTTPVATNANYADITEIANGNGYTTGGATSAQVSSAQTSGTYKLVLTSVTFTASGGTMATFRYVVLYDSTPASKQLIGWYDYGSTVSLLTGETFSINVDGTNGTIQIV